MPRKYEQRQRAESQAETRARIITAAVALHTTVGPARTTDSAVADRAGVTRRTFYRHFPTDVDLFRACRQHWLELWRPPDLAKLRAMIDPSTRLRAGLADLYAYYRVAGAGLAVITRDAPLMRREITDLPSVGDILRALPAVLLEGWNARGRRRDVLRAAIAHATAVTTWQSLVQQQGLSDDEAVTLLVALVLRARET